MSTYLQMKYESKYSMYSDDYKKEAFKALQKEQVQQSKKDQLGQDQSLQTEQVQQAKKDQSG